MSKEVQRSKLVKRNTDGTESSTESEKIVLFGLERFASYGSVLAIIIGLATAFTTIWNYYDTRDRELKKPFYELQLKLYAQAIGLAGEIASKNTVSEENKAEFRELYWAKLGMVENSFVDMAMVKFKNILESSNPRCDGKHTAFEIGALYLSHCAKKSLEKAWHVKLGDPDEFPCNEKTASKLDLCLGNKN
jgi:hypothetical protein